MSTENEHKNHRQRLRARFLKNGLSGFEPHEVLELLLFYVIPQQDTNPLAHRLINHFGSLSAVMDADTEDIIKVSGVKDYSASILKLIPEISTYYHLDKVKGGVQFTDIEKIAEYFMYNCIKDDKETLSLMMLDNNMRLVATSVIATGAECSVDINLEILARTLFKYNAPNFILVHNHPGGDPYPSYQDAAITQKIYSVMLPFNKVMMEHLIIAGNRYIPIIQLLKYNGNWSI